MTELHQSLSGAPLFAPALPSLLEADGRLHAADLLRARAAAEAAGKRLDQALLDLGLVSEAQLGEVLRTGFGVAEFKLEEAPSAAVLPGLVKPGYLAAAQLLPVVADEHSITLAMVDPFDDFAASAIALRTGRAVLRRHISRPRFEQLFAAHYGAGVALDAPQPDVETIEAVSGDIELLRDAASDAPVIRFVQDAIRLAVERGASDIHLRPTRNGAEMLFRVDGVLVPQAAPEARSLSSVISRLKILASLDISERRLPQDGRIRANVGGRPVDIRLSTMPHIHGEAVVLRLLSRELAASRLSDLGFSPGIEAGLDRLFEATDGLILVTGPTGSGKSTTLHAALKQLIRPGVNIVTIEDPVEYRLDGAAQIQVDDKLGLTFPRVLRSLLRQDPDIILVGEIRDAETARIAVQAALTGHLVLATLHTNAAPDAVPRLIDMGVEPYLLAAVLRGVLAQRLVRRHSAGDAGDRPGRLALGEMLLLDAELTTELARGRGMTAAMAERFGYRPLADDARARLARGEIDAADLKGVVDVAF